MNSLDPRVLNNANASAGSAGIFTMGWFDFGDHMGWRLAFSRLAAIRLDIWKGSASCSQDVTICMKRGRGQIDSFRYTTDDRDQDIP